MSAEENPPAPPANQVPNATPAPVEPVQTTCALFVSGGGPGPMAESKVDVKYLGENTELVVVSGVEETLYRGGLPAIGTTTKFVMFDGKKVVAEVAPYLQTMISAAAADGHTISVTSGFRTMAKQQEFYDAWMAFKARSKTPPSANPAAPQGHSLHQAGIAVDLNVHSGGVFEWMVKHAWKYGFIRSVADERWHWEYWGNWEGQEKPEWATKKKWGPNGHQPKTMFSIIPRNHQCGVTITKTRPGGILSKNWWNNKQPGVATANHTDARMRGKTNSWIGVDDTHLPSKFDTESPGWNSPTPSATPPTT